MFWPQIPIMLPNCDGPVIINISSRIYGHAVRNGDMVGFCNIVEHLRKRDNRRDIKLHIEETAIHNTTFCHKFHNFLLHHTDYLSAERGTFDLPMYDMWIYRMSAGDHVRIGNPRVTTKKVCIFPVFDASYNTFRNWPINAAQSVIDYYSQPHFDDYKKLFCGIVTPTELEYRNFEISSDFEENLQHLMECEYYVGGDTGMSHFAGALDPCPPNLIYYLNRHRQHREALPFHYETKAKLTYF